MHDLFVPWARGEPRPWWHHILRYSLLLPTYWVVRLLLEDWATDWLQTNLSWKPALWLLNNLPPTWWVVPVVLGAILVHAYIDRRRQGVSTDDKMNRLIRREAKRAKRQKGKSGSGSLTTPKPVAQPPTSEPAVRDALLRQLEKGAKDAQENWLRNSLQDLLTEGVELKARCPSPFLSAAFGVLHPATESAVDDWEQRIEELLKPYPMHLARFRAAEPESAFALTAFAATFADPLMTRIGQKCRKLEAIIKQLPG